MHVRNDSSEADVCADGAIVWSLRPRVTIGWPSEWPFRELVGGTKESEFLFYSEPWFFSSSYWIVENFFGKVPEIRVGRNEVLASRVLPLESFAHHQDVVTSTEGIGEVGNRPQDDFRIFSGSLVARGSVVIPFWEIGNCSNFLIKSSAF